MKERISNNFKINDMKAKIFLGLVVVAFLWSCSSPMKYTWTKENYQGKAYNSILVMAESATQEGRMSVEDAIVKELAKQEISATNSLGLFPAGEDLDGLTEDEIELRIASGGYDGVLITSLVDAKTRDVREEGGSYYQPTYYRYGRSIRRGYVNMQAPDYYRQEKSYVLESQFFDVSKKVEKEAVVWSGQSTLTDPSSASSAASSYAKKLVKTLVENAVVK